MKNEGLLYIRIHNEISLRDLLTLGRKIIKKYIVKFRNKQVVEVVKKRSSHLPLNKLRLRARFRICSDIGVDEDTILLGYYDLWLGNI